MEKLFVNYELAVKLENRGFKEKCFANIDCKDQLHFLNPSDKDSFEFHQQIVKYNGVPAVSCPLYQQVVDWFREKHSIHISIDSIGGDWYFSLYKIDAGKETTQLFECEDGTCDYHETLALAITHALTLIIP